METGPGSGDGQAGAAPAMAAAASISFNPAQPQVHVYGPGAAATITGNWDAPPGLLAFQPAFSLAGSTPSGHPDAFVTQWSHTAPVVTLFGPDTPGTWSATIRLYHTGPVNLTVTLALGTTSVQAQAQTTVTMDYPALNLIVQQPPSNMQPLPVGPGGTSLPFYAEVPGSGPLCTVSWELQQQASVQATNQLDELGLPTIYFYGTVEVLPAPLGSQSLTVTAACQEAPDVATTVRVPLTLLDKTPPNLVFSPPLPAGNALLLVADNTGTVKAPFAGTVSDTQSGVASLTSAPGGPIPVAADGSWSATLTFSLGVQQATFTATDNAGNTTTVAVLVTVVSDVPPASLDERLGPAGYLQALLDFASQQIITPGSPPPALTTSELSAQFGRDFVALVQPPPGAGTVPGEDVNELRPVLELTQLVNMLAALSGTSPAPAPLLAAQWNFDDSSPQNLQTIDVSGNQLVLSFAGAAVGAGVSGNALDVSGTAHAQCTTLPVVGDSNADFTVSFFLCARGAAQNTWRTVIHKGAADGDRTFSVFLVPGTYQLWVRVSTTDNNDEGLQSAGTVGADGTTWTHVTYVKSGNQLLLYLDGRLDSQATLSTPTVGNTGPLYVGGDPWHSGFNGLIDDLRVFTFAVSAQGAASLAASRSQSGPIPLARAALNSYRQAAYQLLLQAFGTSYEELRLLAPGDTAGRTAVAQRLGIASAVATPDPIDQLTWDPSAISDSQLQSYFGLQTPATALRPVPTPTLLLWQQQSMANDWAAQDAHATIGSRGFPVIIDPDLITSADLTTTGAVKAPGSPGQMLSHRADQVTGWLQNIQRQRQGVSPQQGFTNMLTLVLPGLLATASPGGPTVMQQLADDWANGVDITSQLAAYQLTLQSFGRLLTISRLSATGTVTADEWQDADFILTQVQKQADPTGYPAWAVQENAISLNPTLFQVSDSSPPLLPWRASPAARAAWDRLLQARTDQLSSVDDAFASAVAGVEAQVLPLLRDALVTGFAGPEAAGDAGEQLSELLAVDVQAGGTLRTTRLQTATGTVIDVIQSVRDGLFPPWHPASGWKVADDITFDVQWPWFTTPSRWAAAVRVFLYPENLLQPSLLPACTTSLSKLVSDLQGNTALSPDGARAEAASFLGPLRDQLQGSQLAGPDTSLILRLDYDDRPGSPTQGTWTDISHISPHYTVTPTTGVSSDPSGLFQAAQHFDGLNGTIQLTASSGTDPWTPWRTFTISFWAYPQATHTISTDPNATTDGISGARYAYGPIQAVANGAAAGSAGAGVSVGTNGVAVFEHSDGYLHWVLRYDAPITGWTHICVVYDYQAQSKSLFVDGVQVARTALWPWPHDLVYARPDELGNTRGGPGPAAASYGAYRGWLADVRIHNVALTADQAALLAFTLTDQRTDAELAALRQLCKDKLTAYLPAGGSSSQTPAIADAGEWLTEVFFHGPVQLALALQASGEYSAALGWFRTVYDYTKPSGQPGAPYPQSRAVYYPLSLEQNTVPDLGQQSGWASNLNPHAIAAKRPNPYTRYIMIRIIACLTDYGAAQFTQDTPETLALADTLYQAAGRLLGSPELRLPQGRDSSGTEVLFPNPALTALQSAVNAALANIRQGRNAAGLLRNNDPQPTAQNAGQPYPPTPYHYKTLLDRARQLASTAQQLENEYLAALEKYDNAAYREQDAASGLKVATQNATVASDRVTEAGDAITVANKQKQRADDLATSYQDRINNGLTQYEKAMLGGYNTIRDTQDVLAGINALIGINQAAAEGASISGFFDSFGIKQFNAGVASTLYTAQGIASGFLNDAQAQLQANTFQASHERQVQDWQLQVQTAHDDSAIAQAQITLATSQQTTANDAVTAASLQQAQAQANATFLATQFTNAELYQWMSEVLAGVYRSFLQQASATALLARDQLAFERQAAVPPVIRDDYWNPPTPSGASSSSDRRGLTGAEDLLADITQLDSYGFGTDQRRLNLSQTFSLAQMCPLEFELFRETGTLDFATPIYWFDECFPGHYLRRIQQVRVSVVALIPPSQGIRATLTSSGLSRMVVSNGGSFQQIVLRRPAETVALTSPAGSSGVFQVDLQPDMLLPFEGSGVGMTWQLDMPQAGNPFDYTTVADVLITIDYTALSDDGYRQQVIRSLNAPGSVTADRGFSLASDFPDQWYALANPASTTGPPSATVTLQASDFPAMLTSPQVSQLVIALVLAPGATDPGVLITLEHGGNGGPGGKSANGIISTRRGNASAWKAINTTPIGDWTITLDAVAAQLLNDGILQDLQFIVGYTATGPAWR
jgi:Tc toxin complex TcA C-terminal TcB-binding domain/Concanavalin A-like lectin/glucanases superfamily/ABC toxin N-terminal region